MPNSTGTGSCGEQHHPGPRADHVGATAPERSIQYTTSGAAAAVVLEGTVTASTTLQPVNPLDPPLTVTTTRYAGDNPFGTARVRGDADRLPDRRDQPAGIEGVVGLGQ